MIVFQYSIGNTDRLLGLTQKHHEMHSKRLGYEYRVFRSPVDPKRSHYWQKPLIILSLIRSGYKDIVYLDADTFWLGCPLNPEFDRIGACYHGHIEQEKSHHNAGVLYLSGVSEDSISKWLNEPDDGSVWGDNWSLKKLVDRGEIRITSIDYKWNSVVYHPLYRCSGVPVVAAWHGLRDPLKEMARYISESRESWSR